MDFFSKVFFKSKTIAFGLLTAVAPVALDYLAGIDPVETLGVSPTAGALIGVGIMALRIVTKQPLKPR